MPPLDVGLRRRRLGAPGGAAHAAGAPAHHAAPTRPALPCCPRLSLLSYRTKQANRELVAGPLGRTEALLDRLEAEAATFAPPLPDDGK